MDFKLLTCKNCGRSWAFEIPKNKEGRPPDIIKGELLKCKACLYREGLLKERAKDEALAKANKQI